MFNKCILMGRITADPELKSTNSGTQVTTFRLAVDRAYAKDGNRVTDFLNVVAWSGNADFICKYFHKGDAILIDGNIQTRAYEDKKGNKRNSVDIVVDRAFFAPTNNAKKDKADPTAEGNFTEVSEDIDWDIPF